MRFYERVGWHLSSATFKTLGDMGQLLTAVAVLKPARSAPMTVIRTGNQSEIQVTVATVAASAIKGVDDENAANDAP